MTLKAMHESAGTVRRMVCKAKQQAFLEADMIRRAMGRDFLTAGQHATMHAMGAIKPASAASRNY